MGGMDGAGVVVGACVHTPQARSQMPANWLQYPNPDTVDGGETGTVQVKT